MKLISNLLRMSKLSCICQQIRFKLSDCIHQYLPTLVKYKGLCAILSFVVLVCAINFIFNFIAGALGYTRTPIILELLVVYVLVLYRLNVVAFLLFVFYICNEVVFALLDKLQLFTLEQVLNMASFVVYINKKYLLYLCCLGLTLFLLFCLLIYLGKYLNFYKKLVAIVLILISPFIIAPNLFYLLIKHRNFDAVFSSLTLHNYRELTDVKNHNVVFEDLSHPAVFDLTIKDLVYSDNKPAKILYITAESWGFPLDENMLQAQLKPLLDNKALTIIKTGKAYAENTTIAGELRELCGKRSRYLSMVHMSEIRKLKLNNEGSVDCWPNYLKDAGYKITALHAANGKMYDRATLYNIIGFDEAYFDGNMPVSTKNRCRSWPGYCDLDLIPLVKDKLLANQHVLFYWMSLNSHIPFERYDIRNFNQQLCDRDLPKGSSDVLCNYHLLHIQFFAGLSDLLSDGSLKGLQVIIAGDHKPAFTDGNNAIRSEDLFLDNAIAYIYLVVN